MNVAGIIGVDHGLSERGLQVANVLLIIIVIIVSS